MFKKLALSPWTALITLALVLGIRITDPVFVESVRLRYFDQLIIGKSPTENNIVTVNIDEATLDKYGQWPFKRDVYAKIIENLYQRGAGVVVFNVLMTERDRQGGDSVLAATLSRRPVILANVPSDVNKNIPRQPGIVVIGPHDAPIPTYPGVIANIPELENRAIGVGTTNTRPEVDGVNRRVPLIVAIHNERGTTILPSIGMEILRVAAGDTTVQIKLNENGVEKMRIPKYGPISTDSAGRVWIDWSQKSKSYSAVDLPKDFGGAVVIVGVAAAGLGNPVPTSIGSVWPQDLQAAVAGTMINSVVIERPDYADGLELLAIALSGLLLLFLTRYVYVGLASMVGMLVVSVGGSWYLFSSSLWLFDATGISISILLVGLHAYGVKFVSEFLQKQQIKKQFGTYLSPDLVAQLQRQPELLHLGGETRDLTIVFTDVRGFTTISEHYGRDVQGLTKIMNRYMTAMTKKILENRGTLDKYIGDAQMAFWNAPINNPNHAKDAVKTALEMLRSLDEFNQEVTAEGVPAFGMGLGINSDTVVVGNMGSDQRFDYTCLGDGVNLASRLEGQSKPYGVKIVLGPKTAQAVADEYFVLELDKIAVKGKSVGVNIYTVLGRKDQVKADVADQQLHDAMLALYRKQKFDQAIKLCDNLKGRFGGEMDHYYDIWKDRCKEMKHVELPTDWDGVFRATSK